jgi:hypothetical protein
MPQIGNVCPGTETKYEFRTGFCLNGCPNQCMPPSVLVHIENRQKTDKHVGEYISATSLLGCKRKTFGERKINYFVEPPRSWYSLRGTLIHNILQNPGFAALVEDMKTTVYRLFREGTLNQKQLEAEWVRLEAGLLDFAARIPPPKLQDWETEVEFEYPLGLVNGRFRYLRGTIDVLRRALGQILDYKTMGDMGIDSIMRDGAKQEHEMQFNIYRFLVERGHPVGESYKTYEPVQINEIRAYYMTMMKVVATGAVAETITRWVKTEPSVAPNMVGKDFLEERVDRVCKKGKRKDSQNPDDFEDSLKRRWRLAYKVPDVKLADLDQIEEFIRVETRKLIDAFDTGTMPEMCPPATRQWLCDFCPNEIKAACDAQNKIDGVERIVEVFEEIPVEA